MFFANINDTAMKGNCWQGNKDIAVTNVSYDIMYKYKIHQADWSTTLVIVYCCLCDAQFFVLVYLFLVQLDYVRADATVSSI